jgi:cytochrome o ubiquinol oxidase subunit 1
MPLYVVGLMGMARRMQHYDNPAWHPWLLVAGVGALTIFAGIACQAVQLFVSIRTREQRRDLTGDPWNGRTLEWSTASPPPAWNFGVLPQVSERDAFWARKQRARALPLDQAGEAGYGPIEMPRNSPVGFVTAFFAVVGGFALIWHIWWLAGLGLLGALVATLFFAFRDKVEDEIPSDRLALFDRSHPAGVAA